MANFFEQFFLMNKDEGSDCYIWNTTATAALVTILILAGWQLVKIRSYFSKQFLPTKTKVVHVNLKEEGKNEDIDHLSRLQPFSKLGISLSYLLNEFVENCGGSEALKGV